MLKKIQEYAERFLMIVYVIIIRSTSTNAT